MTTEAIQVSMSGEEAEQELRSFYRWLQDDEDIRRHARVSLHPNAPKQGEMGSALEAIELVLNYGFEVANFAFAYAAWRQTRRDKPKVTIKRGEIEVTITDDEKTIKNIIQALNEDTE